MSIFLKEMERDSGGSDAQPRKKDNLQPDDQPIRPVGAEEKPGGGDLAGSAGDGRAKQQQTQTRFAGFNLDLSRLQKMGMVTPNLGNNQIIEEYRYIKRPLLASAFDSSEESGSSRNKNVIVVTSTLPGEGKTFTSLNLAMSVAMEKDKTVLLVDADMEQTGLTRLLDISRKKGLSDYLTTPDLSLDKLMLKSENVPKLTILPSGQSRRDAAEILASVRMRNLVEDLSSRYSDRLIIIDSPPLLASSSASILTRLGGQTILVVASSQTSSDGLEEALSKLDSEQRVRLILNKAQYSWKRGHYAYGYYGYKKPGAE